MTATAEDMRRFGNLIARCRCDAPGPDRANFRSATPMGFARAVFAANHQPQEKAA